MPNYSTEQMVCVDSPPLATLPIDRNADESKKLLPKSYGTFRFLQVIEHPLTMFYNGNSKMLTIYRAFLVRKPVSHTRRLKETETFFQEKNFSLDGLLYGDGKSFFTVRKHLYGDGK